jgi:uncharacterized protein (UPF0332 family)
MTSAEMIATARKLLAGEPSGTDMRRSVSTIYYAVFNHVRAEFSRNVVGARDDAIGLEWEMAYRFPDHGRLKTACLDVKAATPPFSNLVLEFAAVFVRLQDVRIKADYSSHFAMTHQEAEALVVATEQILLTWAEVSEREQRRFTVFVCLKSRNR